MGSLAPIVWAAAGAMIRVLLVAGAGALLTKYELLDSKGRKIMAEVCTYGLLPCLLGTKIAFAVSNGGGFGHWFMLPLWSAGHIGLGFALSRAYIAVSRRCGGEEAGALAQLMGASSGDDAATDARATQRGLALAIMTMTISFPNSGALPLALMDSLCSSSSRLLGDDCHDLGTGYISLYIVLQNPMMWLVNPRILMGAPGAEPAAAPLASTASGDGAHGEIELKSLHSADEDEEEGVEDDKLDAGSARGAAPHSWRVSLSSVARQIPPPAAGAAIGLVVGFVPPLRNLLMGAHVPLRSTVTDALEMLGSAAVPVMTVGLGSSLYARFTSAAPSNASGRDESMPKRVLFVACIIRLLVVPLISVNLTMDLYRRRALPQDMVLVLTLMLEACTPAAMQNMIFCQLFRQSGEGPMGTMLMAQYAASLVTLTTWIAFMLHFLQSESSG